MLDKYKIRKLISIIFFRRYKIHFMKKKLENNDFTIISNNCIGGLIYKDFSLQFSTPTIGLYIKNSDYIKFISNLEAYLKIDHIEEVFLEGINFPCGRLGDIIIYFMHYSSFNEAVIKWNTRKKRINFNNIYIVMSMDDTFDEDMLEEFNKLRYNKVLFSNKKYLKYDFISYIPGFEDGYLEDITRYFNIFGTKIYECNFDTVKFLNTKTNQESNNEK